MAMSSRRFIYSKRYFADLEGHVFPIEKYKLLHEKLIKNNLASEKDFLEPEMPSHEDLLLVHTKEYLEDLYKLKSSHRTIYSELPLTKEIVDLFILSAGGTILAARIALEEKISLHIGGGWHHAFPDKAEGFCYINDVAIAIKKLKKENIIKKPAVIDCDLHQGNGTAFTFKDDKDVFTFSIHQENLYPTKQKSSLDIGLDDFADDNEYLSNLEYALNIIFDKFKPDFVFYLAGADPYEDDQLGLLKISMDGLKKRDELVFSKCKKIRIPVAVTLAGGYARNTEDTVNIHYNTCKSVVEY